MDSTAVYDAVSTQDTVTQLRAAIRKLLRALEGSGLAFKVRMALSRDDDYAGPGKPPCDWDDAEARDALVDALVHDALAALAVIDGEGLDGAARDAAELLALVAGQDVEQGDDGMCLIARKVATDRASSPRSIPRLATTGTRAATAASTATRRTCRSTPTAN